VALQIREHTGQGVRTAGLERAGSVSVAGECSGPILLCLVGLLLVGCASGDVVAQRGRHLIIGMDADTLQSCAGIPTRTKQLDARTELYSYENKYERTGGAQITLPIIGGGFSVGGSGSYCHAIVRVVDGRVAAVNYTGDNDELIGKEGVCAPICRGCLRAQERSGKES
jgi:hypothetical protein